MPKFIGSQKTRPKKTPQKKVTPKAIVRRLAEIENALIKYYMLEYKITKSEAITRFRKIIKKKALALLKGEKGKIAPWTPKTREKKRKGN